MMSNHVDWSLSLLRPIHLLHIPVSLLILLLLYYRVMSQGLSSICFLCLCLQRSLFPFPSSFFFIPISYISLPGMCYYYFV
jgi:hypothetical protein